MSVQIALATREGKRKQRKSCKRQRKEPAEDLNRMQIKRAGNVHRHQGTGEHYIYWKPRSIMTCTACEVEEDDDDYDYDKSPSEQRSSRFDE